MLQTITSSESYIHFGSGYFARARGLDLLIATGDERARGHWCSRRANSGAKARVARRSVPQRLEDALAGGVCRCRARTSRSELALERVQLERLRAGLCALGVRGRHRARLVDHFPPVGRKTKPFSLTARFPNPEAFIAGEIEVDTAAIPSTQYLDSQAQEAIVRAIASDMQSPLKELTSDNHVVIPFHGLIMTAQP